MSQMYGLSIIVYFATFHALLSSFYDSTDCSKSLSFKDPSHHAYVKEKYEHSLDDINYLLYPAHNSKRLYILFTGAVPNIYTMWSWFWDPQEIWNDTSYLFLKDDQVRCYLGTEEKPLLSTYQRIIELVMQQTNTPKESVFTLGHSMGGFAAIYFTLKLGLGGALTLRPQIDWENASHFFASKKLGPLWHDLDTMVQKSEHYPIIFIQYGEYPADKNAALKFLDALRKTPSLVIAKKSFRTEHSGYYPTKKFILTTLNYMEKIGKLIDKT